MPKPATSVTLINDAARKGVSIGRFKISREQGTEIKKIEQAHGQEAALAELLRVLRLRGNHD